MDPIGKRITQPTPEEVRAARKAAGLTQGEAGELISPALVKPYRNWQSYEVRSGGAGARAIPLASWELFLLLTNQHPRFILQARA